MSDRLRMLAPRIRGLAGINARSLRAILVLGALVAPGIAHADVPLGTAVGVVPQAVAELGGQQVTVILGSDLYQGQTITTGANGEVQIIFVDDTRMVIGPNSALTIEQYLLRDPTSFTSLTVNALGGTFRWISGDSPHDAYTVQTPNGTIGFRGTVVDFTVSWGNGMVNAIVLEGAAYICPTNANLCTNISQECSIGTITSTQQAGVLNGDDGRRPGIVHALFPYTVNQLNLQLPFRTVNAANCSEDLTTGAVPPPTPPAPPAPPAPPTPPTPPTPPPPPPPPPPPESPSEPPPPPPSSSSEPPPPSSVSEPPPPASSEPPPAVCTPGVNNETGQHCNNGNNVDHGGTEGNNGNHFGVGTNTGTNGTNGNNGNHLGND